MRGIKQRELREETNEKRNEKLTGVISVGVANGSTLKKKKNEQINLWQLQPVVFWHRK
jgi:hypothetical protein